MFLIFWGIIRVTWGRGVMGAHLGRIEEMRVRFPSSPVFNGKLGKFLLKTQNLPKCGGLSGQTALLFLLHQINLAECYKCAAGGDISAD